MEKVWDSSRILTGLAGEGFSFSIACVKVLESCPILLDPVDCILPCSSVHGILQARILERVAISFPRGSSRPTDQTCIFTSPALAGRFFTTSTTCEALSLPKPGSKDWRKWLLQMWTAKQDFKEHENWRQLSTTKLEKGMAAHSSIHAWEIPRTEEPGGLQSMGSHRDGHNWETNPQTPLKGYNNFSAIDLREIYKLPSKYFFSNIYFCLFWVFVAAHSCSPVVVRGRYSLLWCTGFSLK